MKNVLVTGSEGFIGKNLIERLSRCGDVKILKFDVNDKLAVLEEYLKASDFIFHLAGINRPLDDKKFEYGNAVLTKKMINMLEKMGKDIPVVLSSSVHSKDDTPYGVSKKNAEGILVEYSKKNTANIYIYRFPNIFGKWCRPNYNSVVATFCDNIANGKEITVSDENKELELLYIDDVVNEFLRLLFDDKKDINRYYYEIAGTHKLTLKELADKIYELRDIRKTSVVPDLSDKFMRCLHATYMSYIKGDDLSYKLGSKTDDRGVLTELIKSRHFGQIFVSTSHKGVMRGNHYHNTKIEKFCVLKGKALIKFRHILEDKIFSYNVSGDSLEVVDIPPGYTHSIENLESSEIMVLFWSSQIFDPEEPDTYNCKVEQ